MNGNYHISAIILVKDEEPRIARCLKSLSWTDEQIVVDNGSLDRSAKIAKQSGALVIKSFESDFSMLRSIGQKAAKGDWILYIDADEEVPPALRSEILAVIQSPPDQHLPHAYRLIRKNYYLGFLWPYHDQLERLFWRQSLQGWKGRLHESPIAFGSVAELTEPLIHVTHRTLEEMTKKTNSWSRSEARLRLEADHPLIVWWRLFRVMMTGFWEYFVHQKGWTAGTVGWIESLYQAFSMFITYAKLWEFQQEKI